MKTLLNSDNLIINGSLRRNDGYKATQKLIQSKKQPDAIFCANDTTALSAIIYLKENGIKVPENIAIVGFSNEPFSEVVSPSISTIKQPGFIIGKKAAELIIKQITSNNKIPQFETIVMPTELIIRESSRRKK